MIIVARKAGEHIIPSQAKYAKFSPLTPSDALKLPAFWGVVCWPVTDELPSGKPHFNRVVKFNNTSKTDVAPWCYKCDWVWTMDGIRVG